MKLSENTLAVLKNFVSINSNIEFKKGTKLATIAPTKTVLAKATVADDFPKDFCIHDLNQFLAIFNMNKDCEIEFDEKNVIIKSTKTKTSTRYRTASKNTIVSPPEKEITLPSSDVVFTLTADDLNTILKNANLLQSDHVTFHSQGEKIVVNACNENDDSAHVAETEVADGNGKKFKAVFLTENLKMMPGSYEVTISFKGISHFKSSKDDIEYWIAIETKHSKFEEQ